MILMDKMREEFEKWMKSYWFQPNLTIDKFGYENEIVSQQWNAWQASRKTLVVKLPKLTLDGVEAAEFYVGVIKVLDKLGVSYE